MLVDVLAFFVTLLILLGLRALAHIQSDARQIMVLIQLQTDCTVKQNEKVLFEKIKHRKIKFENGN